MMQFSFNTIKRCVLVVALLVLSLGAQAAQASKNEKLDSIVAMLNAMPDDSTRLRQSYIEIQRSMDQYWAIDLIEYAQLQAERQHHLIWAMAFRGCKVRWTHRFRDWKRMDQYIMEQREKAIKHNEYGNYLSQIGQSAIVMAQMGRFEQSWQYILLMEKDMQEMKRISEENYQRYEIVPLLVKADYYKYRGDEAKRLSILLSALENRNVQSTNVQRLSLHIELIDVFGQMGMYKEALQHADSVLYIYERNYSPERRALPQLRGDISDANLRKVEIYHKLGDYAMMKKSLKMAEEYVDVTEPKHMANIHFWWAKYYMATKDFARSLENFDKAAALSREYKTENDAVQVELSKVELLMVMGDKAAALDLYTQKLQQLDSVRTAMIVEQQDYLDELDNVLTEQERGETMKAWRTNLMGIVAVILVLIVVSILVYVIHIRRKLKRNHCIIEEKLKEANDADKEKERFLRNITKLIDEPLQKVVTGAKRLSEDTSMTQTEQAALVAENKGHVGRLLELVNNVLDLSRLEAGMMKYSATETDVVLMLMEFVASYNMRHMEHTIRFGCDVDSFTMTIDNIRFSKIIEGLFAMPYSCTTGFPTHRAIKVEKDDEGRLLISITGSLYGDESKLDETERMANKINMYVLRDFNSQYMVTDTHDIFIRLVP